MAEGPAAGLSILDTIDLPDYHLLPATRADFLRRLGRVDQAADAYRAALALPMSEAQQRFLTNQLSELAELTELTALATGENP
jgi:RNA polymerase sigma-70 factor (ECF subfamily)